MIASYLRGMWIKWTVSHSASWNSKILRICGAWSGQSRHCGTCLHQRMFWLVCVYSDQLFVHPPAISVASSKTCLLVQRLQSCHLENREHDRDLYEQCPKSRKLTGRFSFPFSCLRSECYLSRWDFLVPSLAPRQQSRRLLDMDVGRSPQQRIDWG